MITVPLPQLQVKFSLLLGKIRSVYLQEALLETIEGIDITILDKELAAYVPQESLKAMAMRGLRGELIFAVPYLLKANPYLLGYYRLLLGFSQKAFYTKQLELSAFKSMEVKGQLTQANEDKLPELCRQLVKSAVAVAAGIGIDMLSRGLLDDLALLTVGPQLRGGDNVEKGMDAIVDVFQAIHNIVKNNIVKKAATEESATTKMDIRNAAGRQVLIEFAPDPDIVIKEEFNVHDGYRNIIAIEVKGGTDFSNIHNRVGEAEKSHQKAKKIHGYVECWTVVNVDNIDITMAMRESPTTDRFYRLSALKLEEGEEYEDFRKRVIALTGIKDD